MRIGTSTSCTLALLGLALLPACPGGTGSTAGSDSDTTTDSSSSGSSTNAPTTDPPTTGPDPTTTATTGPDPTTGSTTDSTTDSTDSSTSSTTGVTGALCERLGGESGVADLVAGALDAVLKDDRVNGYFLNNDVDGAALGVCLVKQLGALAECPGVAYDCLDMQTAHAGLGISADDFMDFAGDFSAALDAHQAAHPTLTDDDKSAILAALGAMAPDIVEDPDSNLTVYQRVGRKPGIKALIGAPGSAGSFVDNVLLDVAINGFFGDANAERLNTCLTRQVGGIDGPTKYGLEVDAPAGVDPGVGAGDECRTMADSHAGLVDANDNIGIDINDFGALVTDLVAAMDTAGVQQADQDAILGVLGPMCEDILAPPFKNECPGATTETVVENLAVNTALVDNGYNGSLASMTCVDLEVADDGFNFVLDVELTLGITHTYIGDLTVKLQSPDMTVLTVMSRPGLVEPADDGNGCCGDSSDLVVGSPVVFKDSAPDDAEDMGKINVNMAHVVCKDDMLCAWNPNPGAGVGADFSDFLGAAAVGTWRACVSDSSDNDTGTYGSVSLKLHKGKYDPTP